MIYYILYCPKMETTTNHLPTIENIENLPRFAEILRENPGIVIIKFGAEWCGPCKKIEQQVHAWFDRMPPAIQTVMVDVDESFEVYGFLKTKKMLNGIPAILCYDKGNLNYVPNDTAIGSDPTQIDLLFNRCLSKVAQQLIPKKA